MKRSVLILIATAFFAACATVPSAPIVITPQGEDRYLVDPRVGFTSAVPPAVDRRFDNIWRFVQAGQSATVRAGLAELRAKNPAYLPAPRVVQPTQRRSSWPEPRVDV